MRIPIEITDQMRFQLECRGVTLDSVFVQVETDRATVLIYSVDLARRRLQPTSPVLKFSRKQFAIPRADRLHLATPSYYRGYDGKGVGIRDDMEARYQEDMQSFLTKYGNYGPRVCCIGVRAGDLRS